MTRCTSPLFTQREDVDVNSRLLLRQPGEGIGVVVTCGCSLSGSVGVVEPGCCSPNKGMGVVAPDRSSPNEGLWVIHQAVAPPTKNWGSWCWAIAPPKWEWWAYYLHPLNTTDSANVFGDFHSRQESLPAMVTLFCLSNYVKRQKKVLCF